jgi:hypothetical protein
MLQALRSNVLISVNALTTSVSGTGALAGAVLRCRRELKAL